MTVCRPLSPTCSRPSPRARSGCLLPRHEIALTPHPCNKRSSRCAHGRGTREARDIRRKEKKARDIITLQTSRLPLALLLAKKSCMRKLTIARVVFSASDKETSCLRENSVRNRCDTGSLSTAIFVRRVERVDTPPTIMSEFSTCKKKKNTPSSRGSGKKKKVE